MTNRTSVTGIDVVSPTVGEDNSDIIEALEEMLETKVEGKPSSHNKKNKERGVVAHMQDYKDEDFDIQHVTHLDLYSDLVSSGRTRREALYLCRVVQSQEENYFKSIEEDKVQMRMMVTVAWLDRHYNWSSLKGEDKTEVLWDLGFDVKGGKRWHIREERARDEDGLTGKHAPLQSVVYSGERLDWDYLNTRDKNGAKIASEEAQEWRRNRNGGTLRV